MEVFDVEYTDTFGGQANYSWVNRKQITVKRGSSDLSVVRAAKKAVGLSGVRCKKSNYGWEIIELRPYGSATVCFITPVEAE